MSSRTVVEFNHDYGNNIFEKPAEFMTLLRMMINSGSNDAELQRKLSMFGVTVTPTAHHSCKRELKLTAERDHKPYFEKSF